MSDSKSKIMAERTTQEATSSTPPNGHLLASKSTYSDEASVTYPAQQSDNSRGASEYKSTANHPHSQPTQVSPDNQCSSTSPSSHPSALTGSTKQGDKTEGHRKSSDANSVSLPPSSSSSSSSAHKRQSLQAGSLSPNPNTHRNTNDAKLLRCELCHKFFSETDFDSKTTSAAPLTKAKFTVCPDCHKKIPEVSRMAPPPSQTKNVEFAIPSAGDSSAHANHATAARPSQCCCTASHQVTTSQTPPTKSETVSPELLRTIKTEPPSEPYVTACTAQDSNPNPNTYHNHTYQTKCSIYLTANLKPCGKRDKEAESSSQDPSSCGGGQQNKKAKLDNSKDPSLEKGQSTIPASQIKTEMISPEDCSADVKPLVAEVKPSSNGHAKVEVKQEPIATTESCKSSFKFKSPTKPAPQASSGATKTKVNCISNTYMFEGSMLWKPVHPESATASATATSTPAPKSESADVKSEAPSGTEKKDPEENTFCCEGSLFIKPLLPNEFAFEGTMYIKPDSPLLKQAPLSFANQPSGAPGSSSMPQTTKTLTIQSVFTNSGQVISSITSSGGDKSEHATSNGNSQTTQTQTSTFVTTDCVGSGSKCTMTSRCTSQFATPPKDNSTELKKKTEQEKNEAVPPTPPPAGLSQCPTSGSGGGGGGGHTDFSVKSILSTTDRRSSCDNTRRYQQH